MPCEEDILPWTLEQVELEASIEKKYDGYIKRQRATIGKQSKMESKTIPEGFNYDSIQNLSTEARQKFKKVVPGTVGQGKIYQE